MILASASPRRLEIFQNHGFTPRVIPSDIEENIPMGLSPEETVMFLSLQKGLAVRGMISHESENTPIIAADTIVVCDGEILGKPADKDDATRMINMLSGRSHQVITGVTVLYLKPGEVKPENRPQVSPPQVSVCFYDSTDVHFVDIPEADIEAYVETEEPYDKAGAYAVQGTFAKYTERVDGDLENVIGFPFSKFKSITEQI